MNSWASFKENHSDCVRGWTTGFCKVLPLWTQHRPLSSLTHTENAAAAAVIMCTRENRNLSLKNLSPVLQKCSLKTMKRRKPLAWGNCRVHDFRFLTQFFASFCNILLIQSRHLKIASVFSLCQEIAMIGPILQLCMLIISKRNYACGKYAGSGLQKKQMCLWDDSPVLHKAICRKVWDLLHSAHSSHSRCALPSLAQANLTASSPVDSKFIPFSPEGKKNMHGSAGDNIQI